MTICYIRYLQFLFSMFTRVKSDSQRENIIAVINIGTNFFSYAYYIRERGHEIKTGRCERLNDTAQVHVSQNIPASIQLDVSKNVRVIGFQGEDKFEMEKSYLYFFRKFNKELQISQGLDRNMSITDVSGHKLQALEVISLYLGSLKKKFEDDFVKNTNRIVKDDDLDWIMTVPRSWSEAAKSITKEALAMNGIDRKRIFFAFEEEVVAIFVKDCLSSEVNIEATHVYKAGSKFAVINVGEVVTDLIVLEVTEGQTLKQVKEPNGQKWILESIYKAFWKKISRVVGADLLKRDTFDLIDIERQFADKIKNLDRWDDIVVKLPSEFLNLVRILKGTDLKTIIKNNFTGLFQFHYPNKLILQSSIMREILEPFDMNLNNMLNAANGVLQNTSMGEIRIILLGYMSDFKNVRKLVKQKYPLHSVIDPGDASISVSQGAILYHLNQKLISSRVSKYTYGIENFKV